MMERIRYFAYGSNMDLTQMNNRCPGGYEVSDKGELDGWRLIINRRGYANIIPDKNSKVFGLILNLSPSCLLSLDKYEGYPNVYNRKQLPVKTQDASVDSWVYVDEKATTQGRPYNKYLERIIIAARALQLPEDYISQLESFQNK